MSMPYWALSAAYWLHMLATVVWIGSLASLTMLVLPAARAALESSAFASFLSRLQRRLDPVSWASLVLLAGTGMFQMSANPNYAGFLAISNRWAVAILVKHLVFFGMIGVSAYITWGLLPQLQRAALRRAHGQASADEEKLQQLEQRLMRLNLLLGIVILGLTALARAS